MAKVLDWQKTQMTQNGFENLQKQLEELKTKRPGYVERLANARSMGDLSENNDYHNAKEALEFLDGQIDELEEVIRNADVVHETKGKKSTVDLGASVKVGINGIQNTFHIVGEWEADPKERKISHESPLGKALVGRKVGDKVEVEAPAGKIEYTVLGIE